MKILLLHSFLFIQFFGYASRLEEGFLLRKDTIIPGIDREGFGYRGEFPLYPGGEVQLLRDLRDSLVYPELEKSKGIEGVVKVRFYVEKDGSVSGAKAISSIANGENLSTAAENAVMKLKKFTPVRQNGKPAVFQMDIPVRFSIPKETNKIKP